MECGMKLVIAIVLIGVGAGVELKYRDVAQLSGNAINGAPILLVCVGVFILIIAFFGCCGAYKENYCMVTTFAVLLVLIFILELAAGIAALAMKNRIDGWMTESVQEHIKDPKQEILDVLDKVQQKFECCGAHNYTDWQNSVNYQEKYGNGKNTSVPDACCVDLKEDCGRNATGEFFKDGCVVKFEEFIAKNAAIIGGVGVGIAFVQLIGIMFACCLMRAIKKQYEVV